MSTSQIAEPPSAAAAESSDGRHDVVELDVTGMTCGSCVARVQRALAGPPGVSEAPVNFATGRATVDSIRARSTRARWTPSGSSTSCERPGYGAKPVDPERRSAADAVAEHRGRRGARAGRSAAAHAVAVPLATAIVVLTYAEPHDVTARWIVAALAVPIQFWCGLPFLRGRGCARAARTTNMDTLIALATLTAFVYATVELLTRRTCTTTAVPAASSTCPSALRHPARSSSRPL